jgi:multicomponent Na+:H+ antiporter subunit D
MIGLPVLPGFVTKFQLAMCASGNGGYLLPVVVGVLLVSMVLNAAYYVPALLAIWSKPEGDVQRSAPGAHFALSVGALAALVVLLGFFAEPVLDLIRQGIGVL